MSKRTLLKLVQDLGASVSSDEIDSLDETTETTDIATFLRMAFDEVLARRDWEFLKNRIRTLDDRDAGDTQINRLRLPSDASGMSRLVVRYRNPLDVREEIFSDLRYMDPWEFVKHTQSANENDANVVTVLNDDGVSSLIFNDRVPTHFTSFDEEHLWFDAYEASRGTGNITGDVVIITDIIPVMDWTDPTATLPIPERMEMLVFNEALQICAVRLRQTADPTAQRVANRQYVKMRDLEPKVNRDEQEINYGRRGRGSGLRSNSDSFNSKVR